MKVAILPYLVIPSAASGIKGVAMASVTLGMTSLSMPSPESIVLAMGAVGMGWYALRKKDTDARAEAVLVLAKADAEAFKIKDEARKGTTTAQLEDAIEELKKAEHRLKEAETEISEVRNELHEQRTYNLAWADMTYIYYGHKTPPEGGPK